MLTLVRAVCAAVVMTIVGLVVVVTPATAAPADPTAVIRAMIQAGFHGTTDAEYRAWVETLTTVPAGPATRQVANEALAGSIEDLRAFVDGELYRPAWNADERVRVARVLAAATGPSVTNAAQDALASSDPQVWSDFLATGFAVAQYADDRLMAATMLTGGVNNSGPALDAAAQAALAGTPDELREFLLNGQFVARAVDAAAAAQPPAAPAAPPAVAAPPAAAPRPAQTTGARQVLATTGPADAVAWALAATAVLVGAGLLVVSRRARRA